MMTMTIMLKMPIVITMKNMVMILMPIGIISEDVALSLASHGNHNHYFKKI